MLPLPTSDSAMRAHAEGNFSLRNVREGLTTFYERNTHQLDYPLPHLSLPFRELLLQNQTLPLIISRRLLNRSPATIKTSGGAHNAA